MTPSAQPSAPEYNIATLLDIARIPAERIPALLAELPRLLDDLRPLVGVVEALGPDQAELVAKQLVWVDDGISDGSRDEKQITIEEKA